MTVPQGWLRPRNTILSAAFIVGTNVPLLHGSEVGQTAVETRQVYPKQIKIRISTKHLLAPKGTHLIVPCRPHCPYFHCAVKQFVCSETAYGEKTNCQNVPLARGLNILPVLQKLHINQVIADDSSIT